MQVKSAIAGKRRGPRLDIAEMHVLLEDLVKQVEILAARVSELEKSHALPPSP
jgi:hypothetical protein